MGSTFTQRDMSTMENGEITKCMVRAPLVSSFPSTFLIFLFYFVGKGKFSWANGETYTGLWFKDLRHGKGLFEYADGHFYEGAWVYGKMHGKGRIKYSDGEEYIGDFHEDARTGKGVYKWSEEEYYEGDFVDGLFNGTE